MIRLLRGLANAPLYLQLVFSAGILQLAQIRKKHGQETIRAAAIGVEDPLLVICLAEAFPNAASTCHCLVSLLKSMMILLK